MSDYEKKQLEMDLTKFISRNFVRPSDCRDVTQIQFYVRELCARIEDYESRFNYVPQQAYTLLAQYNLMQNKLIYVGASHVG